MYLLSLEARGVVGGAMTVQREQQGIRKWTLLDSDAAGTATLRFAALACCGHPFVPRVLADPQMVLGVEPGSLCIEYVLAAHAPYDRRQDAEPIIGRALRIESSGRSVRAAPVRRGARRSGGGRWSGPGYGTGNTTCFSLAHGSDLEPHEGDDDFEFRDPFFRARRYASLLDGGAKVTDPVHFLSRLNYRAVRCARFPAQQTLARLSELLAQHLDIATGCWSEKAHDFARAWKSLAAWQRRAALPALDAARHLMDAFPHSGTPLLMPGVLLVDRCDEACPRPRLGSWIRLMHELLPGLQLLVTLAPEARSELPDDIREASLALPEASARPAQRRTPRQRRPSIVLAQVDGRLPNLALMKLGSHFKSRGKTVELARGETKATGVEAVYASAVFFTPASRRRMERLRQRYGDALVVGGSGVDLTRRLPREIESLPADYQLYPELGDRAMGFLTRGCPSRCRFCIVPHKEGNVRRVSDLDTLLQGRSKLILLDDNILAHPDAGAMLEEMVRRDLQVNFNQTLDIRRVDEPVADILSRVRCANVSFTRSTFHFSLNGVTGLDLVRRSYERLGFSAADNVQFICMYGFDTSLEEDVERFRFLRSLPGAYVFVQEYQPVLGATDLPRYELFDENTDDLIDELVDIVFTQSMKSMEKYYRWLSKRYAERFGRLHPRLVDTIFRYNSRDRRGRYEATLAGTRPLEV